jgi:hypothetical protein
VKVCTLMLTAAVLWLAAALARRKPEGAAAGNITATASA